MGHGGSALLAAIPPGNIPLTERGGLHPTRECLDHVWCGTPEIVLLRTLQSYFSVLSAVAYSFAWPQRRAVAQSVGTRRPGRGAVVSIPQSVITKHRLPADAPLSRATPGSAPPCSLDLKLLLIQNMRFLSFSQPRTPCRSSMPTLRLSEAHLPVLVAPNNAFANTKPCDRDEISNACIRMLV